MWQSSDLERKIFMRPTNCIFCGVALTSPGAQQPNSRTKEHVYARWYRDNVVNQKIKMFTSDGTTATMERQPHLEALVNSSVCAECYTDGRYGPHFEAAPRPPTGKHRRV
jgi:hypothetical protein